MVPALLVVRYDVEESRVFKETVWHVERCIFAKCCDLDIEVERQAGLQNRWSCVEQMDVQGHLVDSFLCVIFGSHGNCSCLLMEGGPALVHGDTS